MIDVKYLLKRTAITVFLLWLVLTILFVLFKSLPGSFATVLRIRGIPEETVVQFIQQWQLNEPLHVQYFSYLNNVIRGNWGVSIQHREPVLSFIQMKIFNTFILVAPGITTAYLLGAIYGILAGTKPGGILEKYGVIPILTAGSLPSYVTSILLIIVFSGFISLLPSSGMLSIQTQIQLADAAWWRPYVTLDFGTHYLLPFTAVVMRYLYLPSLLMRTSVVEVSNEPFVFFNKMTAIPKAKQYAAIMRHASLPVITMYPISLSRSLGGLVLIETVFNWPGIGAALIGAVFARDFPVLIFVFLLIAAFIIIANYIIDILYVIIDPRVSISD